MPTKLPSRTYLKTKRTRPALFSKKRKSPVAKRPAAKDHKGLVKTFAGKRYESRRYKKEGKYYYRWIAVKA
jgi:hypothetical protein